MTKKQNIIYSLGGMSPVHLLQSISLAFCVGGCALAFKLGTGPTEALNSSTSKLAWAVGLALTALSAPVLSWYYGRKIASRIALSDDGRSAWIKDANLIGASTDQWPVSALRVVEYHAGDPRGEEAVGQPRVTLLASNGTAHREYVVPLRGSRQMTDLRDALHISQEATDKL